MAVGIAASTKNILRKAAHVQTAQHALYNAAQFLCKTAFENFLAYCYNSLVQRVALMRKTGCMGAARCFICSKNKR